MTALFCVDPGTVVCRNALPCVVLDSCGPQETFHVRFEGGRKQPPHSFHTWKAKAGPPAGPRLAHTATRLPASLQ